MHLHDVNSPKPLYFGVKHRSLVFMVHPLLSNGMALPHLEVLTLLRSMASAAQRCDLVCLNSAVAAAPPSFPMAWRRAMTTMRGSAERRCLENHGKPLVPPHKGELT